MSATPRTHNSDGTRARGSSNGNDRGNVEQRRRRRAYLLETYAADVKLIKVEYEDGVTLMLEPTPTSDYRWWLTQVNSLPLDDATVAVLSVEEVLTARCYRCGCLLHDGTITVDRIHPKAHGGAYTRDNVRPTCGSCNSITGGRVRKK